MRKWTINRALFFLSIVPCLVVMLLFGSYLTFWQIKYAKDNLKNTGDQIIHHLNNPVSFYIFSHQPEMLRDFVASLALENYIQSVTLYDEKNSLLDFAGVRPFPSHYLSSIKRADSYHKNISFIEDDNTLVFAAPVYRKPSGVMLPLAHQAGVEATPVSIIRPELVGWVAVELDNRYFFIKKYQIIFTNFLILLAGAILLYISYRRFSHRLLLPMKNIREKLLLLREDYSQSRRAQHANLFLEPKIEIDEFQQINETLHEIAGVLTGKTEQYLKAYEQKTIELEESLAQLEVRNVEIEQDRKNAMLEAKAKSDLVAGMHYEIKAPLNSLISFVELLAETHLNPFQNEYLTHARVALRQLNESTAELVEAMLFDSAQFSLASCSFDLRECIDEVLLLLAPQAYQHQIEVISHVFPDVPLKLLGDGPRLKLLLLHFSGCIIQGGHQGDLVIRVSNADEQDNEIELKFELILHKPLQPEKDIERLLHLFAEHNTYEQDYFPHLNYNLAKKIVRAMGGSIHVEHNPHDDNIILQFNCKMSRLYYPEEYYLARNLLREYSILIYDNNAHTKASLSLQCMLFEMNVIDTDYAHSIEQIVEQIATGEIKHFDIALLGFNQFRHQEPKFKLLLGKLRQYFSGPIIVAVNTSNTCLLEDIEFCGADYCLMKPVSYKKLHNTFYELLRFDVSPIKPQILQDIHTVKALVTDDNPANMQRLVELLQEEDIAVSTAHCGEQALHLSAQTNFDIVYLDIKMPDLDGYEVARRLRTLNKNYKTVPIIAVSAYLSQQEEEKLLTAGINDYLIKPVKRTDIHSTLVKWLKNYTPKNLQKSNEQGLKLNSRIFFQNDKIIEWDKIVKCANGNETVAHEIFNMFIVSLPEVKAQLQQYYMQSNYKNLLNDIHKLHGSASYCGVPRLKEAALEAEKTIKNEMLSALESAIQKLFVAIDEVLDAAVDYV